MEEAKIRMNKTVRNNLRVRLGDIVSVHQVYTSNSTHCRTCLLSSAFVGVTVSVSDLCHAIASSSAPSDVVVSLWCSVRM